MPTLLPFQEEGVTWMLDRVRSGTGCILGDDMGMGKTVQACVFLQRGVQQGLFTTCLILAPNALILDQWRDEIRQWCPSLSPAMCTYASIPSKSFDVILLDEAQSIKNRNTKRAQALLHLPCRYRIALTGTVFENNHTELWALLDTVSPGILGSYADFRKWIGVPLAKAAAKYATPRQVIAGSEAMTKMRRAMDTVYLRRTKSMLKGTTTKTDLVLWVKLDRSLIPEYRQLLKPPASLSTLASLRRLCLGKDTAKLGAALALLYLLRHHHCLVFARHLEPLDAIQDAIPTCFRIDGKIPPHKRSDILTAFRCAPHGVLLLSIGTGGVGINLTRADRVLLLEPDWNPQKDVQASDRAYRHGQESDVVVYRLITAGTVEENMYRQQVYKMALARHLLDPSFSPTRYFSRDEMSSLLQFSPHETQVYDSFRQQQELVAASYPRSLEDHIASVTALPGVEGVMDQRTLFYQHEVEPSHRDTVPRAAAAPAPLSVLDRL